MFLKSGKNPRKELGWRLGAYKYLEKHSAIVFQGVPIILLQSTRTSILLEHIGPLVVLHPCFWSLLVFIALSAGPIIKHRIRVMEVGSCT